MSGVSRLAVPITF